MNMTFDGWIVVPTEHGYVVAVSRDFTQHRVVRMKHSEGAEDKATRPMGYGWVRNGVAIDDEGGVYRGEEAYLVILYAFVDYRGWAFWLARGERRLLRQGVRVLGWVRGSGRCGGACSVAPQSR